MNEPGAGTFAQLLKSKVANGSISSDDSVLVQFAGSYDETVCAAAGLVNCHFANIAPGSVSTGDTVARRFDAHRMPHRDESFDHVIAHSGLHHCSRPQEALYEMYRLARKSVVFVENQDSPLMRAGERSGLIFRYELPAVVGADYVSGGVDGSAIPNFVYRWTRRELHKTVASFDPAFSIPIDVYTEWNLGLNRASSAKVRKVLKLRSDDHAETLLIATQKLLNILARKQGNIFAATIRKDLRVLHTWMQSPVSMRRPY
ncbi:methyltransferase domain-containing protein [uncultured Jatrophihabitans sp.]|uniref:methyltransferase domain-containing protein n=1 Tax=uncultured Jatrophihabitans sp. TaxID=1610747 RepID=UPI0035CC694D